jgi:hypothetical protein
VIGFHINGPYFSQAEYQISIGKDFEAFIDGDEQFMTYAKTRVLIGTWKLGFAPSPSSRHRLWLVSTIFISLGNSEESPTPLKPHAMCQFPLKPVKRPHFEKKNPSNHTTSSIRHKPG